MRVTATSAVTTFTGPEWPDPWSSGAGQCSPEAIVKSTQSMVKRSSVRFEVTKATRDGEDDPTADQENQQSRCATARPATASTGKQDWSQTVRDLGRRE